MSTDSYHKRKLGNRVLQPETQMMGYGYDPALSEGSLKHRLTAATPHLCFQGTIGAPWNEPGKFSIDRRYHTGQYGA